MSVNALTDFVHRTARVLSVGETTVYVGAGVAGVLLVFALGVLVQVMLISREKKVSLRSTVSLAFASLWAIPVLAVLAFFAFRVVEANALELPNAQTVQNDRDVDQLLFQATEEAPAWVTEAIRRDGNGRVRGVVLSARGATVAHAERRLRRQTLDRLRQDFPNQAVGIRAADVDALRTKWFEQRGYEQVGEYRNNVSRVYWLVDFSQARRKAVREAAVVPRLWTVGGVVALLALICVAVTMYLRLDASTEGRYRFRLKFATTVLLVAAGMLVAAVVPVA